MKYLVALQVTGHTLEDFDALVELENSITQRLDGLVEWDGHDFGSGEGNIFVGTDEPERAFKAIKEIVGPTALSDMRIAFKDKQSGDYTVLWPPDLKKFVIK